MNIIVLLLACFTISTRQFEIKQKPLQSVLYCEEAADEINSMNWTPNYSCQAVCVRTSKAFLPTSGTR